jgi:thiol-disulfide isomerase/thioredoxin
LLAVASSTQAQQPASMKIAAPALQGIDEWINSKPLSLKDLKGKVVVVHFWTFGCINCIHNYPSYKGWHKDFADKGVVVIGIHTPETRAEKKIDIIRKMVKDNGMKYPIAVDGSAKTWQAWGNRYWPSVYLIDKKGNGRYRWDGELNWKGQKGESIMRKKIEELLADNE